MKKIVLFCVLTMLFASCSKSDGSFVQPNPTGQTNPSNLGDTTADPDGNSGNVADDLNDITEGFQSLMYAYGLVGAQVAITRNSKLVYFKSFGKADLEKNTAVNENSLFRIAGISKAITLMAISKLVSENKLNLEDLVFGKNALLGTQYGTLPYEPLEESITVSHLLEHKGGFSDVPFDIMLDDVSLSQTDLIGKVLDERSLSHVPGTTYEYSNFGYSLLGRIIEKVSGLTYDDYVKTNVLVQMNITDMEIGGNQKLDALEHEVTYYSTWKDPYEMNVNRMDSHGGWVTSAKQLARFAIHSDTEASPPDLLAKGEGLSYLKDGRWIHNGALPGSTTILKVGYPTSYVVLLNYGGANFHEDIQGVVNFMNAKVSNRTSWPIVDFFEHL